ncbi:MAG: hypothetical protein N4A45_01935 [Flavobacteriales bacterium]|nr:hypothetical protein [Flavobacteriales bacterium]
MHKYIYLVFTLSIYLSFVYESKGQVGIGTTSPHSSAILDLASTTKGFLPPRLSLLERNNISSPSEGLVIYNTTQNCLEYFNGDSWFDLCCSKTVNENLASLQYVYRLDPTKANTLSNMALDGTNTGSDAGIAPNHGDYVYSAEMIHSNGSNSATLVYSPGSLEPVQNTASGDGIFIYEEEASSISYQQKDYLTRTVSFSNSTIGAGSKIENDISPDLQQEMEMFIVAKFDGNAPGSNACFFASADGANKDYSFQIGSGATVAAADDCTADYFTLRFNDGNNKLKICGKASSSPDGTDKRVSVMNDELHVFNIRSYLEGGSHTLEFLIDGELVSKRTGLSGFPLIEKIKLLTNRNNNRGSISSIGELIITDQLLTTQEQNTINNYLLCKYSEH